MKISLVCCFMLIFALNCNAEIFHESRKVPYGWYEITDQPLHPMTLTFALKQRNTDILEEVFWLVSTPGSQQFRNYLHPSELKALIAPEKTTVNTIADWLVNNGVQSSQISLNPSEDFLIARAVNPLIVSSMFQCNLRHFAHKQTDKIAQVCSTGYTLPDKIAQNIDFVGGLTHFPRFKYQFPLKPRVTSSSPILVKVFPGDENFSIFYAPVCPDGSTVVNSDFSCSDGSVVNQGILNGSQFGSDLTYQYQLSDKNCMPCSSWPSALQSYCQQTNDEYGLSSSTLYCHTGNVIYWDVKNYIPIPLTVQVRYQDSSLSASTNATNIFLGEFVTPKLLREYYEISDYFSVCRNPFNSQAVAEFLGQFYNQEDLASFFKLTGVTNPGNVELYGYNNNTFPGIEASLDIQYIMGVAQNVTTYFWSDNNKLHDGQEPFLEWITEVLNDVSPPLVHSVSYGDDENSLTSDYMNRVNVEFQKAGTLGISILVSSGDNGVNAADPSAPSCAAAQSFTPGFPASSPYVTAVGGTQFSTQSEAICNSISQYGTPLTCSTMGEISASTATGARITSGGGFSNVFPMPSYQVDVVGKYVNSSSVSSIPSSYYNANGRAYPDIAACARNFLVVYEGEIHPTDGTSAAAPTAAAMITLINDQALENNLPTLGFLNPTLYSLPYYSFNDIVQGDNSCGESECCHYGFPTSFGWDAVTGFGTINFPNLLSNMLAVQSQ